jgi:type IV pilus assembly protein PilC
MVKMGEESGKLSGALNLIAAQLEKDWLIRKKIKGALIYPTIVVVALVAIGILLLTFVVPTLVSTFAELGIDLPLSTQFIIAASNFLIENTVLAIIIFIVLVFSFWRALRTPKGRRVFDWVVLHMPIISPLVKMVNAARTSRTLASLTGSGVKILEALDITNDVIQNSYYREVIQKAKKDIEKGKPISSVFIGAEDLYPILVGEMMAVGEETGQFSQMLDEVAVFYEEEVSNATKNLSTVVEPILMLVVGAVVGFFAISMISPMYSMVNGI